MHHGSKLSMVVVLVSALGACTALPLDQTRAIPHISERSPETVYVEPDYGTYWPYFTDELRKRYAALMVEARGRADVRGYYHFRDKGHAALIGDLRGPDRVASREIADDAARRQALELRRRLVIALEGDARLNTPVEAATAEASFDCWLAELEAGVGAAAATRCREDLVAALERIGAR